VYRKISILSSVSGFAEKKKYSYLLSSSYAIKPAYGYSARRQPKLVLKELKQLPGFKLNVHYIYLF